MKITIEITDKYKKTFEVGDMGPYDINYLMAKMEEEIPTLKRERNFTISCQSGLFDAKVTV